MVMKDKLYKLNGKKTSHSFFRKFLYASLTIIVGVFAILIPTYLTHK